VFSVNLPTKYAHKKEESKRIMILGFPPVLEVKNIDIYESPKSEPSIGLMLINE
jgi:hypothetical protein